MKLLNRRGAIVKFNLFADESYNECIIALPGKGMISMLKFKSGSMDKNAGLNQVSRKSIQD